MAKALLDLAERFGRPVEAGVRVSHDLTQEELAQLVGASRETVNKALADFAGRGTGSGTHTDRHGRPETDRDAVSQGSRGPRWGLAGRLRLRFRRRGRPHQGRHPRTPCRLRAVRRRDRLGRTYR